MSKAKRLKEERKLGKRKNSTERLMHSFDRGIYLVSGRDVKELTLSRTTRPIHPKMQQHIRAMYNEHMLGLGKDGDNIVQMSRRIPIGTNRKRGLTKARLKAGLGPKNVARYASRVKRQTLTGQVMVGTHKFLRLEKETQLRKGA